MYTFPNFIFFAGRMYVQYILNDNPLKLRSQLVLHVTFKTEKYNVKLR